MNDLKSCVFEQFARIGKALSSPGRLELLDLLSQGEKTVELLCEQSRLGTKNTSAQLKELKSAKLIISRKDGKYVYYKLANESVLSFYLSLQQLAENRFAELQQISKEFLADPTSLSPIDRKTLLSRAKKGDVIVIDVRPSDEYQSGHLPYARSIPLSELREKMKSLPNGKTIVAYCRGPYCFLALDAVKALQKKGFKAIRFEEGVTEWKLAGLPIEANSGGTK